MKHPLVIAGSAASPYSRKTRSLLRYRRIPFQWIGMNSPEQQELPPPPLPLIPVLHWPQGDGYSGADRAECEIDGTKWTQTPFRYQGKCLTWLREARGSRADRDREAVDAALAGTGRDALLRVGK